MAVCTNCGEDNPERAKFCLECGAALTRARGAPKQARKTVTVLFSDMTGSTALAEQVDPESMRAMMDRYFTEMRAILERHGGTIEKFIGDAVMAVFGIPIVHEDDALRAVRAAGEMQGALASLNLQLSAQWGVSLEFRTGINTGEVIAGDPAQGQSFVTGDAVNVAARLEQRAEPGEILLGKDTYRLVRDSVAVERVAPLALKGKTEPVAAWRLKNVAGSPTLARRLDSSLVGRQDELETLRHVFEQAVQDRSCRLGTILGTAGVGKSRLAAEFLSSLGDQAEVLRGRCLPYGEGITFWPVAEVVKDAARITDADSRDVAQAKLGALLGRGDEDEHAVIRERLTALLGLGGSTASIQQSFWAVRRLFELLARSKSLVIVFDDIHWAEPTFLDLIDYIVGFARSGPLLLLCMARPELLDLRSDWGTNAHATSVPLVPLGESDSQRLIDNLLGQMELPSAARQRISQAAQGNPLFVEEMVRMWVDEGVLAMRDGRWVTTGDFSKVAVPPSINALLAARLDRLGVRERDVLQRGAVIGEVFWWGSVADMSLEEASDPVGSYLQALVRKELIGPEEGDFSGEDAFRFTHILIRDAAYNAMPKAIRAGMHERFASWLERKAAARITEYEEILGYHLEQAHLYRRSLGHLDEAVQEVGHRAATHLVSAAALAYGRGDMPAAIKLWERALSLLPDPARQHFVPGLGIALIATGAFERAEGLLAEAKEHAAIAGNDRLYWHCELVTLLLYFYAEMMITGKEVRERAQAAISALEGMGDHLGLSRAWRVTALSRWWHASAAEAEEAWRKAIEYARVAGDQREEAESLCWLAHAATFGPTPVPEALKRCDEILESAHGDRVVEAFTLDARCHLEAMEGRFDEGRRLAARAAELYKELGQVVEGANLAQNTGDLEMLAGDYVAAEQAYRLGFDKLDEMREKGFLSTVAAQLAHALCAQGRYGEAERFSLISEQAGASDDTLTQILWRGARAKVAAQAGEAANAQRWAREAVAMAEKTDWLNEHAGVLMDFAQVLLLTDQVADAILLVQRALALYDQKGNIVSATKARNLLEELTSKASAR